MNSSVSLPVVTLHRSFDAARAAAAGLLDGASQPGPFDRLDWFEALHASAFAERPVLIAQAQSGQAQAWLFLIEQSQGRFAALANWYSFVARPQFVGAADEATRAALVTALASALKEGGGHVRLHPVIDAPHGSLATIRAGFQRAGWHIVAREMATKRRLRLPTGASFADYWLERPGVLRTTVARKSKRHPMTIAIHHSIDDALWQTFEQVFMQSWKPSGDDFAFLRGFAEREAEAGRLRLGIATLDSVPAAVELWTVDQGCAYIHKLAYAEALGFASPGSRLSQAMFCHAIDVDHVHEIDFGTGDNSYKSAWMPESLPMWQLDLYDLRRPAMWPSALRATLSSLRPRRCRAGPSRRGSAGAEQ